MQQADQSHSRSSDLVRGSPEWTALVSTLMRRNRLDDLDELCRLMGVEEIPVEKNGQSGRGVERGLFQRRWNMKVISILIGISAGLYLADSLWSDGRTVGMATTMGRQIVASFGWH